MAFYEDPITANFEDTAVPSYEEGTTMVGYEEINDISFPSSSAELSGGEVSTHKSGKGKRDNGGTVICGVCGAVRYYSFVKQARKFGVYSCESCRKFISKMIHNKTNSKLECNEEKGECSIPAYVINPLVSARYSHLRKRNARCPACWLKMCLRAFFMPQDLVSRLGSKLPEYMQDPKFLTSKLPYKLNLKKGKNNDMQKDTFYKAGTGEFSEEPETHFKGRQRRKAATEFMKNIARFTGRVKDEVSEQQPSHSESLKKKHRGSGTNQTWRIVKKESTKTQTIKTERMEDRTTEVKVKPEIVNEEGKEESIALDGSVQDVIKKVGRPRLIIFTRDIEFDDNSDCIRNGENMDSSFVKEEVDEDPFYNWHAIG